MVEKINAKYSDVECRNVKTTIEMLNFDFLIPYIEWFVAIFVLLIVLYLRTYITERAKINALKSQNAKLTREKESIKKDFQLEIERRKYQYESKKEQFIRFFQLLDSFGSNAHLEMQGKMMPIIDEFNRNYFKAAIQNDKKGEMKATAVFSSKLEELLFDAMKELTRIKNETNTIRLIASEPILRTLNLLELAYDKGFDVSSKMMKELHSQMATNDQEGMAKNQLKMQAIANLILNYKTALIDQMKMELNEI